MARLIFSGAAQTVTGSAHLVEVDRQRILLDCGLFQGRRKQAFERNRSLPFDPHAMDAVLLSHAHIDHCGNLPTLVRGGFRGPIFATSAACDLARVLLMDSAQIQENDVAYVNRLRRKQGKHEFEPLYTQEDARRTLGLLKEVDYRSEYEVLPGVVATFFDAGHMLGSASIRLEMREANGTRTTLVFSGDIGRNETPILRNPEIPDRANYLLMESTYGDRLHPEKTDVREVLRSAVHQAFEQQGKLIIPAFSVGRTQEIVYRLNELSEADHLPEIPVFLDSPLATEAMAVFKSHPECFDQETISRISREEDQDPLAFAHFHYVETVEQSKKLNEAKGPCVIISASGMCESGRVTHHLKNSISDPSNIVLFSGYQAPHTLGRKILEGQTYVPILGSDVKVRAKICRLEGMSGHADQSELLAWARAVAEQGALKGTALVHGELESMQAFAEVLRESNFRNVETPASGQIWDLGPENSVLRQSG